MILEFSGIRTGWSRLSSHLISATLSSASANSLRWVFITSNSLSSFCPQEQSCCWVPSAQLCHQEVDYALFEPGSREGEKDQFPLPKRVVTIVFFLISSTFCNFLVFRGQVSRSCTLQASRLSADPLLPLQGISDFAM